MEQQLNTNQEQQNTDQQQQNIVQPTQNNSQIIKQKQNQQQNDSDEEEIVAVVQKKKPGRPKGSTNKINKQQLVEEVQQIKKEKTRQVNPTFYYQDYGPDITHLQNQITQLQVTLNKTREKQKITKKSNVELGLQIKTLEQQLAERKQQQHQDIQQDVKQVKQEIVQQKEELAQQVQQVAKQQQSLFDILQQRRRDNSLRSQSRAILNQ